MLRWIALCCLVVWALLSPPNAQAQPLSPVRSPILTIDSDRLYQDSDFGQGLARVLEQKGEVLLSENRRIEGDLEAEELALTEQRKSLDPETFRALADAFDEKVQDIRSRQNAKAQALNNQVEEQQRVFLQAIAPILEKLMREAGAAVILEQREVFYSVDAIDITSLAIERINAALDSETAAPDPTALPDAD